MPVQNGSYAEVEGVVERIVFFNEENHFCIAQIKPTKQKFQEGSLTITGVMPNLECGETVLVKGQWLNHKSYGLQIKVSEFESRLPSTIYGLEKFLGSGMIAGIGKEYAKRIVARFGQDTLRIIDSDSKRLTEVEGIGAKRNGRQSMSVAAQRLYEITVGGHLAYAAVVFVEHGGADDDAMLDGIGKVE